MADEPRISLSAFSDDFPLSPSESKDIKANRFSFVYTLSWKTSLIVSTILLIIIPLLAYAVGVPILLPFGSFVLLLATCFFIVPYSLLWSFFNNAFLTFGMNNINWLLKVKRATYFTLLSMTTVLIGFSLAWAALSQDSQHSFQFLNPFAIIFAFISVVMTVVTIKANKAFLMSCLELANRG